MCILLIKRNRLASYMWYVLLGLVVIGQNACVYQIKSKSSTLDACKRLIHFPKAKYMRIKGEGESIRQAVRQGKSEIARILSAQINSMVELEARV